MKMRGLYILDVDRNPVPCEDSFAWAKWMHGDGTMNHKQVALSTGEGWELSTAFLGVDFNVYGGAPLVFESRLTWADDESPIFRRYGTWDDASAHHAKVVAEIRAARGRLSWEAIKTLVRLDLF